MSDMDGQISVDEPIRDSTEDLLDRADLARSFAEYILTINAEDGVVAGVFGDWGEGKTSFINMVKEVFDWKDIPVIDFNPWMFNKTGHLVEHFFNKLSSELRLDDINQVNDALIRFGDVLEGQAGSYVRNYVHIGHIITVKALRPLSACIINRCDIEEPSTLVRRWWFIFPRGWCANFKKWFAAKLYNWSRSTYNNFDNRRNMTEDILRRYAGSYPNIPIIVVLDDIDRLESDEIRQMVKLVRLVANFPHIVYIMLCARERVECALGGNVQSGRDYLEKIIQVPFDLPKISRDRLDGLFLQILDKTVPGITALDPDDSKAWQAIRREIIQPRIRNMRDVYRYRAVLVGTIIRLQGRVAIIDVLALEAIRLFLWDVYKNMEKAIDYLTVPADPTEEDYIRMTRDRVLSRSGDFVNEASRKLLVGVEGVDQDAIKKIVEHLFAYSANVVRLFPDEFVSHPNGYFLERKRVIFEPTLRFYLEQVGNRDLHCNDHAVEILAYLDDEHRMNNYFHDDVGYREWWGDIVHYMSLHGRRFHLEHAIPTMTVLWNLILEIIDMPPSLKDRFLNSARSITIIFLEQSQRQNMVGQLIDEVWDQIKPLSSKMELMELIISREQLSISNEAVYGLKQRMLEEFNGSDYSEDHLSIEWNIYELLEYIGKISRFVGIDYNVPDTPRITLALLQSIDEHNPSWSLDDFENIFGGYPNYREETSNRIRELSEVNAGGTNVDLRIWFNCRDIEYISDSQDGIMKDPSILIQKAYDKLEG